MRRRRSRVPGPDQRNRLRPSSPWPPRAPAKHRSSTSSRRSRLARRRRRRIDGRLRPPIAPSQRSRPWRSRRRERSTEGPPRPSRRRETKPLTRIQKIAGPGLHRNWVTIPHVTNHEDADITELEAFRLALNKEQEVKVTLLAFLMKASVAALQKFPNFNSSLEGDHLVL